MVDPEIVKQLRGLAAMLGGRTVPQPSRLVGLSSQCGQITFATAKGRFVAHRGVVIRYYFAVKLVCLAMVVVCAHARATPLPRESAPPKVPMQRAAGPADQTHRPAPIDAQVMQPIYAARDDIRFTILMPAQEEPITQEWWGYFLADGKKIANTDFKIVKVINGRGATGSIAANRLSAPNKLPSSDVRLFSPRYEH